MFLKSSQKLKFYITSRPSGTILVDIVTKVFIESSLLSCTYLVGDEQIQRLQTWVLKMFKFAIKLDKMVKRFKNAVLFILKLWV